ncbi:MAG: pyrimidine/purine nucleoside phosphorylase [Verrucomicrobiaceae bacterium]|nr:pyrimidine/purine nucleoside phosphorylase [Verrucomicrobiaceae bacterium]
MTFENVSATAIANVYFDGKVVSHSLALVDGAQVTLGIIYPGEYHFATEVAECMEITAGQCSVVKDGGECSVRYGSGERFEVPENSGFTISVEEGICQYVCTFLS